MTKAVVVGMGSIGQRHARILAELGCSVAVVSRRPHRDLPCYETIEAALQQFAPDYVVLASETAAHIDGLERLASAGYQGMVLVEKPLSMTVATKLPEHRFRLAAVAYNLRFHPLIVALRERLQGEKLLAAQIYCGQYLPDWRPESDYRTGYSAKAEMGGGALRDLSHEIDYMGLLFGNWKRLAALGGQLSSLEISSDDCWGMLIEYERCPVVTLQLNYLDRPGRREIVLHTNQHTYRADLRAALLECDGRSTAMPCQRDDTYRSQHLAMLAQEEDLLCSLERGGNVMAFLGACEAAAASGRWVAA
jgi:predicted dehydrogenase